MNPALPSNPADPGSGSSASQPGARAALTLLLLINVLNYIDRYVLAAVVPSIKRSFFGEHGEGAGAGPWIQPFLDWCQQSLHFTPKDALLGLLSTAFMVMYMVAAPVFARLAERHRRWLLIGIAVILWSLASGASGLATTFGFLLLTRCFVGVGEAAYGPVAPALISDFYPVKVRGRVLAWFYVALPVGSALGYVLGEQIAGSGLSAWGSARLGIQAEGWRWAFYLVVLPGLLLGILSFFRSEPARGQADLVKAEPPRRIAWRDYRVLLRTPSYVLCSLGMTAMTFAMGGMAFWMPYYLEGLEGAPKSPTTIFGGILVLSGLSGTLLGGWLGDKLRSRFSGSYFLVSGVAMLLGFPLFLGVLQTPFPWIWVLIFLACFCLFFNTGPTNTILANVTHPAMRSAGFALNIFVIHAFGDAISPFVIGILSDRYSLMFGFQVMGFMFLVSGVFWLLGAGFLARDTARAPHRLPALDPVGSDPTDL